MNQDYVEIELEEEPIELCKLLKILDLVEGGGHAKLLIHEGYVLVNDEVCTQKRKKLFGGDTLAFDGEVFKLTLAAGVTPAARPRPEPRKQPKANQDVAGKKEKKQKKPKVDSKTGRKPISFG